MLRTTRKRQGFTLVELLVVMAILVTLAALTLLVVPNVLDQDRTTDGASITRQYLMIAKARAARDGLPRGVRLIVSLDANNPAKTDSRWVTELQYTESPPVIVGSATPNASPGTDKNGFLLPPITPQPTIQIYYQPNSLTPHCYLINGGAADGQIQSDLLIPRAPLMFLPDLRDPANVADVGFWCRVTKYIPQNGTTPPELQLDRYPDLGAATNYVTNDFGVYGAPRPLPGEPTQPLPKDICIDLASSSPAGSAASDYDILFAPNGQVVNSTGQINLWVRNYKKPGGSGGNFQLGGEQQIVALKAKSGSLGVFPVSWTGSPYQYALSGATGYGN